VGTSGTGRTFATGALLQREHRRTVDWGKHRCERCDRAGPGDTMNRGHMTISGELFTTSAPTRPGGRRVGLRAGGDCTLRGARGAPYDAAIVTKDTDGTVHVHKVEMATRHAGWSGAVAAPWSGSCSRR